jgi:hypothetical protein
MAFYYNKSFSPLGAGGMLCHQHGTFFIILPVTEVKNGNCYPDRLFQRQSARQKKAAFLQMLGCSNQ